ncbi:MAG: RHS repeat-associated core domain-containing protein [Planctomycetota bacterium]
MTVRLTEVAALDPDAAAEAGVEPVIVEGTATGADYHVSHRGDLVFNPLASITNHAGKALRLDILRGSGATALSIDYSAGGVFDAMSSEMDLGVLTLRPDGSLSYRPKSDLVAENRLDTTGPGGSFYYANEELRLRVVEAATGEELVTDHRVTISVTNSLPVFRSELVGLAGDRLVLDETIDVKRFTTYTIDLADLMHDPDGDPITVHRFGSLNPLVDPDDDPRIPGSHPRGDFEPGGTFAADAEFGDDSIAGIFGYRMNANTPGAGRRVHLLETHGLDADGQLATSKIAIHHDGEVRDNQGSSEFSESQFARSLTYTIAVTDGQLDGNGEATTSIIEVAVDPHNGTQSPLRPAEAPWFTSSRGDDPQSIRHDLEDSVIDRAAWSLDARAVPSGREGRALEAVGDTLVDLRDGSIVRTHDLVLDGSGGAAEATLPGLVYDSSTVGDGPIVEATLSIPAEIDRDEIESLTARFTWQDHVNTAEFGGAPRPLVTSVVFDDPSELSLLPSDGPMRLAFQPPEAPLVSGVYRWSVEFEVHVGNAAWDGDAETLKLSRSGETPVVVQRKVEPLHFVEDSLTRWDHAPQFGDGWALGGVPQLFVDDYRDGEDSNPNNDRFILWFPGEAPRVFGIGDVETGVQPTESPSRQSYHGGAPPLVTHGSDVAQRAWFREFEPLDSRSGWADPREFGVLQARMRRFADQQQNAYTILYTNAIVYIDADAVEYIFTRSHVGSGDTVRPAWLLQEIRDPRANAPVAFAYAAGTTDLVSIAGTDGVAITGLDKADPEFNVGGRTVSLRLDDDNRLEKITHDDGSNDRVRGFDYHNHTALLKEDRWGGTSANNAERLTTFAFTDGLLTGIAHGGAVHDVTALNEDRVVRGSVQSGVLEWEVAPDSAFIGQGERRATVSIDNGAGNADLDTTHAFDADGNRTRVETRFGGPTSVERWEHDHLGSVVTHTDALGRQTNYRYDYQTAPSLQTPPPTDTSGQYDADDFRGRVTRIDSFAGTTQREYETDDSKPGAIGRLTKLIDPSGLTTEQEWDRLGNLLERRIGDRLVETWAYYHGDSNVGGDLYEPDWAGRVATHRDARGLETGYTYTTGDERWLKTATVTDETRNETTVTTYEHDAGGYVDSVTVEVTVDGVSGVLSFTDYTFDGTGLLESVKVYDREGSSGRVLLSERRYTHHHDGLVEEEIIGSAGDETRTVYSYDERGLLTQVRRDRNRGGGEDFATTGYAYYADGRLKRTTAPDESTVAEEYTFVVEGGRTLLRQTTSTSDAAGVSAFSGDTVSNSGATRTVVRDYDLGGRLLSSDDRLTGAHTTYAYADLRHDTPTAVRERVHLGDDEPATLASTFAYDAQGNLVHERAAGRAERAHRYDTLGYLVETQTLTTQGGRFVFTHNAAGDVLTETEHRKLNLGDTVTFTTTHAYDESGRLFSSTDQADAGHTPGSGSGGERTATVAHAIVATDEGSRRRVVTTSAEGLVTTQDFDGAGRLVREQDAFGGVTVHAYDAAGNLVRTTLENPQAGQAERITAYEHDGLGRLTRTVRHGATDDGVIDGAGKIVTTTQHHDAPGDAVAGWDVTVTDADGVVTRTAYDARGRVVAVRRSGATGEDPDADLLVLHSYTHHAGSGTTTVTTRTTSPRAEAEGFSGDPAADPRTHDETTVTRRVVNTRGDVLRSGVRVAGLGAGDGDIPAGAFPSLDVFGEGFVVREQNRYGEHGLLVERTIGQHDGRNGDDRVVTRFEHDVHAGGRTGLPLVTRQTTVGRRGLADEVLVTEYDSAGNRVSQQVNGTHDRQWRHDQAGRVVAEIAYVDPQPGAPDGAQHSEVTRSWTYDGLTTTFTDRNNVAVETTFTPANGSTGAYTRERVVSAGDDPYTAYFRHNADGSLREAADAWADWDGSATLADTTDWSKVLYEHDEHGRVEVETADHAFAEVGAPATRVDGVTHHAGGARSAATWRVGDLEVASHTATLDDYGRIGTFGQTAGSATAWAGGALPGPKAVKITHNADGRRDRLDRFPFGDASGGGSIGHTAYRYLDEGTLDTLAHFQAAPGGGQGDPTPITVYDYAYDTAGRVAAVGAVLRDAAGDPLSDSRHAQVYDAAGRHAGVDADGTAGVDDSRAVADANHTRDAWGNVVADGGRDVGRQNRLHSDPTATYRYDDEGRLTEVDRNGPGREELAWDHRGHLRRWDEWSTPSSSSGEEPSIASSVRYFYDVLGRKVARREEANGALASHTQYAWDGGDLAFEIDATPGSANAGEVTRGYFHGPGVNEVLAVDQFASGEAKTVWQFADHAGTVETVGTHTHSGGWQIQHRSVDEVGRTDVPFAGTTDVTLGETGDAWLKAAPAVFAGHRLDETTGLWDLRARWYDADAQRMLSEDPLGDAGGSTNLYAYAAGDPLNYIDPDGRAIESVWDGTSLSLGVGSFAYNVYRIATTGEGAYDLALDTVGIAADLVALGLPGVPGGAGAAIKASRGAQYAARTIQAVDTVVNTYQGFDAGLRGLSDLHAGNYLGAGVNFVGAGLGLGGGFARFRQGIHRAGFELRVGDPAFGSFPGGLAGARFERRAELAPDEVRLWQVEQLKAERVADLSDVSATTKLGAVAGDAGKFSKLDSAGVVGDELTPHHMPQVALGFTSRADGGAIVIPHHHHVLTRTYAGKGIATAASDKSLPFRVVLAMDLRDLRQIAGRTYNKGSLDLLDYYRENFPELMRR